MRLSDSPTSSAGSALHAGPHNIPGQPAYVADAIDDIINRLVFSCERVESIHAVVIRANNRIGISRPDKPGPTLPAPAPEQARSQITILAALDRLQYTLDRVFSEFEAARMG